MADFFSKDLSGGAENNDSNLLKHLSSCNEIKICRSHKLTTKLIDAYDVVIVSNFVNVSPAGLKYIQDNKPYIIYEHDHKYVKGRDPSVYPNFNIPEEDKINVEFYEGAHCVVVLSKICKEILEKNIPGTNVHSIGCSLWSKETFEHIRSLAETTKTEPICILRSDNPIKNYSKALEYCRDKNIEPVELKEPIYKIFLSKMASCEKFLFIPGVLETYSRVCAEAKMMNLKLLTTPMKLGFASEEIFSLSGLALIEKMEERNEEAYKKFVQLIDEADSKKKNSITAILTCYRRPEYLQEQINALRAQTNPPEQIWLWVNHHEENKHLDFEDLDIDRVIRNDHNWKFHGRFALAQLAQTNFIGLFDDDTIPAAKWFENCLDCYSTKPGIYGGIGVILGEERYYGHKRVGWSAPNNEITEVDLVGHAWFLNKKDLQYMWREEPFTWHNGEDIQLSYLCQKYGNIKTYVPPHPLDKPEMFSSTKGVMYGIDNKATSRPSNHAVFYNQRDEQVKSHIQNGWVPIFQRSEHDID